MSKLSVDGKGSKLVVSGGTSDGVSQSQLDAIYDKSHQEVAQLKFYTDQELDRLEKKIDDADIDLSDYYTKTQTNAMMNELDKSLREYTKYEAAETLSDAKQYTDEQLAGIEIPDAPDNSYVETLQGLAVVGNYRLETKGDTPPGVVVGRKDDVNTENLMHRWVDMHVALQDLNGYVSNNFVNVKQGWVVEFRSLSNEDGNPIEAKWNIVSEPIRNGDTDLRFDIAWIDSGGQSDVRMYSDGELYIHDGSKVPGFPIGRSRFDQLQEQIDAIETPDAELPENLAYLDKQNMYTRTQTVDKASGVAWKTKKDGSDTLKIHSDGTIEQVGTHNNTGEAQLVNRKNLTDAIDAIPEVEIPEVNLEAYVTKEDATSEIAYRDKILEEIFEDIDDALKDLKITDQTLTDGLAAVNTDAAFLAKLNRFTAKQKIDVPDSLALQIATNNITTLEVWATGEVQQKSLRPNSHPQQFVTRHNVEGMVNNYRPFTWVDHTEANDLEPGEAFIASTGYLYMAVRDANWNLVMLDGTYNFAEKSHLYYRNAAGEAVELFSITNVNVNQGSYIRFQGEEEVVKNHATVGMAAFDCSLFI